ncbi:MAG: hypothetical protein AAGC71_02145 [Pseudomonadota bacterium]
MSTRKRRHYTQAEKSLMWDRWQRGDSRILERGAAIATLNAGRAGASEQVVVRLDF